MPILLLIAAMAYAADEPFRPIEFLLGEWVGEGGGKPGDATGSFSFSMDLDKKVAIRKNHADLKNGVHDDLMIAYPDSESNGLRAIYFDNEGHVINYAVQPVEGGIQFDMAPPGKPDAFAPYLTAQARKTS